MVAVVVQLGKVMMDDDEVKKGKEGEKRGVMMSDCDGDKDKVRT